METIGTLLFWTIGSITGLCAVATVLTQNIVRSATWLLFTLAGTSGIFFLAGADLVGTIQLLVYVGGTLVLVVFGVMLTAQGPFIHMKATSAEWAVSAVVGILLLAVLVLGTSRIGILGPPRGSVAYKFQPPEGLAADTKKRNVLKSKLVTGRIPEAEYDQKIAELDRDQAAAAPFSAVIGEGFLGVGVGPAHKEFVSAPELARLTNKARAFREKFNKRPPTQEELGDEDTLAGFRAYQELLWLRSFGMARPVRANYLLPFEIVSVHLLVVLIGAAYLARAKRRRRAPVIAAPSLSEGKSVGSQGAMT